MNLRRMNSGLVGCYPRLPSKSPERYGQKAGQPLGSSNSSISSCPFSSPPLKLGLFELVKVLYKKGHCPLRQMTLFDLF
jgi:hypothetical protein